uniref:cytochrome c oxidase subunit II n=1 Tax=Myxobolus wulii TaxID=649408 RepID=UPI0030037918
MFSIFYSFLCNFYLLFNFFNFVNIYFFYFSVFEFNYVGDFSYVYFNLLGFNFSICIFLFFFIIIFFNDIINSRYFFHPNWPYVGNFFMVGSNNYFVNFNFFYVIFNFFEFNLFSNYDYFFIDFIFFIFYFFNFESELFLLIPNFGILGFSWVDLFLESFNYLQSLGRCQFILSVFGFQWSWDLHLYTFSHIYFNFYYTSSHYFIRESFGFQSGIINWNLENFEENRIWILPVFNNIFFRGYSLDVNHCFYIVGLGVKYDIFDERDSGFIFNFNIIFSKSYYYFVCYEYCGRRHYEMYGFFYVLDGFWFSVIFMEEHDVFTGRYFLNHNGGDF